MSGLYLHIPFCKQACHYCDFHFSTNLSRREEMVEALLAEMRLQRQYVTGPLKTVYIGGGTPSLLAAKDLARLIEEAARIWGIVPGAEITLEANPDDLNHARTTAIFRAGINRLSIGIQSFHPPFLHFLHRAHDQTQAIRCVQEAQDIGFEQISIDLIYGIAADTHAPWQQDVETAISLAPTHLSAYCLTIEPGTAFGQWFKKGKLAAIDDDFAAEQFDYMVNALEQAGIFQYEVSNFAREGHWSRHNTGYWQQKPYLGIGPSAHSYNGHSRQANVAHNVQYLRAIADGQVPATVEVLSPQDRFHEYVFTSLRTVQGLDIVYVKVHFGIEIVQTSAAQKWLGSGHLLHTSDCLRPTRKGLLMADAIASDFFLT